MKQHLLYLIAITVDFLSKRAPPAEVIQTIRLANENDAQI